MNLMLETVLQKRLLVPNEQKLLRLLFKDRVSGEEILHLVQGLNIDKDNRNYLLMLSHLGYKLGWLGFPEQAIPQLKGIYRYYQAQNAIMLHKLHLYINKLNENNIVPLLLKGDAMRLHFAPGVARMMSDVDLAVKAEEYKAALLVAKNMGATFIDEVSYSITYKFENTKMDIHQHIFKNNHEKGNDLWEKLDMIEVKGGQVKLLSPIDMFIHLLDTQSRSIFTGEFPNRRMKWLYDARMVLNKISHIDWEAISKRANELHCGYRVHLMMTLFATCFPELISMKEVKRIFVVDEKYEVWLGDAMNYHNMLESYSQERKLNPDTAITLWLIKFRFKYKPLRKAYKYYAHELKQLNRGMCYLRYVAEHYQFNRPALLYQKYLSRIRLR